VETRLLDRGRPRHRPELRLRLGITELEQHRTLKGGKLIIGAE
jgi:hypothetical protein